MLTPKNDKYIGYKCIICNKSIFEHERQQIISIGFWQTWCLLCAYKHNPKDKSIERVLNSNPNNNYEKNNFSKR